MNRKTANRIAWAGAWSREHNNTRYAELLPRLENVDKYFVDLHPWWPVRGLRRRIWLPLLIGWLGIRYPVILCTDWRQIKRIRNRVVCDHDDPLFTEEEIRELNRPNVAQVVVTSDMVAKKFSELGLHKPVAVIPQGVVIQTINAKQVQIIRDAGCASKREVVAGLHQPHFEFSDELPAGAQQMYAVDLLFEVMERAREKDPRIVLWLVGEPSRKVRAYAQGKPWVRLAGYKPRSELMEFVGSFDIGLYPRRENLMGRASIKVLEYMASGVPVVGFAVEEMKPVIESKSGIVVRDSAAFAAALVSLAQGRALRMQMGARGKKASGAYRWELLSKKYMALLDHCLLRSGSQ